MSVGATGRLIIQVFTDEGVVGIAEGGRHLSVFRAYVEDLIKPLIVGMSPVQPRRIWETLALGVGQRATRFASQIVGAIDIACWDITGKVAGLPIYTLLGGAARTEIPLYWSRGNGWCKTPEEMLEEIQEGYEKGFRAFKVRMDWRDYRQDSNPANDLANPDILQPEILNVGGLSQVMRVYEMAVANNKVVMPHSPNIGANSAASLHAYSTVTNAVRAHEYSEEFTGPIERIAELFIDPMVPEDGKIKLSDRPGLGLEFDQKALSRAIVS